MEEETKIEEQIEAVEEEEDNSEDYTEKDLDEDEKIQAQFNVDSLKCNIETSEFDLKQMERQYELRIPQRQAGIGAKEAIRTKGIELTRFIDQMKMYKRRVRTGKKKVPVIKNTPAVEEAPAK